MTEAQEKEILSALELARETTERILGDYRNLLEAYRKALETLEKYVSLAIITRADLIRLSSLREEERFGIKVEKK